MCYIHNSDLPRSLILTHSLTAILLHRILCFCFSCDRFGSSLTILTHNYCTAAHYARTMTKNYSDQSPLSCTLALQIVINTGLHTMEFLVFEQSLCCTRYGTSNAQSDHKYEYYFAFNWLITDWSNSTPDDTQIPCWFSGWLPKI